METDIDLAKVEEAKKMNKNMSSLFDCSQGGVTKKKKKTNAAWLNGLYILVFGPEIKGLVSNEWST